MKKIDLHIHTISTKSDVEFTFCLDKLKEYIENREIDCIAITNHNTFDLQQYQEIEENLRILTFPGIEIDLEEGHILLISDGSELTDFNSKCKKIEAIIDTGSDSISLSEFQDIFIDLSKYIIIPHYSKKPSIGEDILFQLRPYISAGEVSSPKKFIYCLKDTDSLVPVYFSDIRIRDDLTEFSIRQTYFDLGEISFSAIKSCLTDKNKVSLSKEEGNNFFDALDSGLKLSTGLNVILGERSSGKTYTLDRIYNTFDNVKYIRQFSLLERNEESDARKFNRLLSQGHSLFSQRYLEELKEAVNGMVTVNIERSQNLVENYISSLIKNAKESERADSFSKASLFSETDFSENDLSNLISLIRSIEAVLENIEYREIIEQHIPRNKLKSLISELIMKHNEETEINLKKRFLNDLLGNIKKSLQVHTAAPPIEDVNLYEVAMERKKIEKFIEIVRESKNEKEISRIDIQGFNIVANRKKFSGAQELKNESKSKLAFSEAYKVYDEPYEYLKALRDIDGLEEADYYRFFIKIEYRILNEHGFDVSGGERSEFQLIQAISDSRQYDMLLIDEPESSFDNLFLMNKVNVLIKDISKYIPVVIVTHNNTVGASIKPDYVVYTRKNIDDGNVNYELFSGYPSDKHLLSPDGKSIQNFDVLLNCLEAGPNAYIERGDTYEILKN